MRSFQRSIQGVRYLVFLVGFIVSLPCWVADVSAMQSERSEHLNLAWGRDYTVHVAWPDPLFTAQEAAYPDTGFKELTDGIQASTSYTSAAWQVFTRQGGRTIQIDLGHVGTITEVMGSFLQSHSVGVYVPRHVDFALSLDGERWVPIGRAATSVGPYNRQVQTEELHITGLHHAARFVQLRFPVDVLVMMDEVQVLGMPEHDPSAVDISLLPVADGNNWRESAVLGPNKLPELGYVPAGGDATGGARHIVLATYAYPPNPTDGEWSAADYLPYVAYVSDRGQPMDWMFDTILLSPQRTTPANRSFSASTVAEATNLHDWLWYIDETFRSDQQVQALDQAVAQAKRALGDPDHKVKVILTLVNPSPLQRDFGPLGPGGVSLSFDWSHVGIEQAMANRIAAVGWLIQSLLDRWAELAPQHLELIGFWWHPESIGFAQSPEEDVFINRVGDMVRDHGHKFFWIPFYGAPGSYDWHNYGFDVAILQPNYMFSDTTEERLQLTAAIARTLGMGIEMEKHWRFNLPEVQKWVDYLVGGAKYGYNETVVGYYQGFKDFGRAGTEVDATSRRLFYDYVYDFIQGNFTPPPSSVRR